MFAEIGQAERGSTRPGIGYDSFGKRTTVEGFTARRRDRLERFGMSRGAEQFTGARRASFGQKAFGEARLSLQRIGPARP
jgi:hypothetical protein